MTDLQLFLPYPPSVNTYWGFKGSRRFLTAQATVFKKMVLSEFQKSGHAGFGAARLSVSIILLMPDKRVRDIDNILKPTLDALCQAQVFIDDSQIDRLTVERGYVVKHGLASVEISML